MPIVATPTFALVYWSAFATTIWPEQSGRYRSRDILELVRTKQFESRPYGGPPREYSHGWHARRIAYLVENFPATPIEVYVDPYNLYINDGNHRLAAAMVRREPLIRVDLDGWLDEYIRTLQRAPVVWKKTLPVRKIKRLRVR